MQIHRAEGVDQHLHLALDPRHVVLDADLEEVRAGGPQRRVENHRLREPGLLVLELLSSRR